MTRFCPSPRLRFLAVFASLAVLAAGCAATEAPSLGIDDIGASVTTGENTTSGGATGGVDDQTRRWGDEPVDPEPDATRTGGGTTGGDDAGGDGPGGDDPGGSGGGLGDPCSGGDDCTSGWCVPGPNGPTCSIPCTDSCPNGWDCKELETAGGDPVYICVDPSARLCHPCLQDADCNQGVSGVHRCVDFGDDGGFCGLSCQGAGASCPQGMVCSPAGDESSWQCVPPEGEACTCNSLAQALALKTQCAVTNESGSCTGWRSCGPDGLSDCGAPTPSAESCNGIDDDCDGETDEEIPDLGAPCEVIGDWGSCPGTIVCEGGGAVCQGTPASAESCNGLDDDCDGAVDESFIDHDTDGVADCLDDDDDDDGVPDDEDCAPFAPDVNPDAQEKCNGLDDDCDGDIDEPGASGCQDRYQDIDGDGFGALNAPLVCLCLPDPATYYTTTVPGDCNDMDPQVNPDMQDICDGIDNNCNEEIDELAVLDTDSDGTPNCVDLDDDGDGVLDEFDCGPMNAGIYPGATELCDTPWDDDCDGQINEANAQGCALHWIDVDSDGWGDDAAPKACLCGPQEGTNYQATQGGDCDDLDAAVNFDAVEQCNGLDDDCDGLTDEGTSVDTDEDGIPNCVDPDDDNDGYVDEVDCAPLNATSYPGAPEVCNGLDDDCDGVPDPIDSEGCTSHWLDADGDGYGSSAVAPHCLCGPDPAGFYVVTNGLDCDDGNGQANPDAVETCNYIDDNCDGEVDEGVASPCGGCSPTCVLEVGGSTDNPYDSDEAESGNVIPTEDGGITLATNSFEFPSIWVANSAEDTVSKLNTETGCEVARYSLCDNPSRTAVDLEGNGIIACRDDGRLGKVAVLEVDCIDKNGNGVIETSKDLNGDCQITANEMVTDDECILWNIWPDGSYNHGCGSGLGCARAAGVDADNYVWVGMWNSMNLHRIHPETGSVVKTIKLDMRPYGLAIAGDGIIWVASRAPHALGRVHPETGQTGKWNHPSGKAYGLAIDPYGAIWVAGGEAQTVARFDPDTNSFTPFNGLAAGNSRGVAVRIEKDEAGEVLNSEVYIGHHAWGNCNSDGTHRRVSVIDAKTLEIRPSLDLGHVAGPVGVAVDSLGFVWTVNQCSSSASKIDPDTGLVVGNYPVGSQPYTYSDMTGYALKTVTTDQGFYREVFDGWPGSQTLWDSLVVEADLPGDGVTWLEVSYRLADTVVGLSSVPWNGPHGPYPPASFPLDIGETGNHLEVRLTLGTSDPLQLPTLHKFTVIAFEQ